MAIRNAVDLLEQVALPGKSYPEVTSFDAEEVAAFVRVIKAKADEAWDKARTWNDRYRGMHQSAIDAETQGWNMVARAMCELLGDQTQVFRRLDDIDEQFAWLNDLRP